MELTSLTNQDRTAEDSRTSQAHRIILSVDAHPLFVSALQCAETITVPRFHTVYSAIASHPDIFLCPLDNPLSPSNEPVVVAAPSLVPLLRNAFSQTDHSGVSNAPRILAGQADPGAHYPESARYNALIVGPYFLHNPRITDPVLRAAAIAQGYDPIPVKQGYARCGALPIGGDALITADGGIARAAGRAGIEVLSIRPGGVELPGFPYGFLGGAAGRISDTIWFHGNPEAHPDFSAIAELIRIHGLTARWFPQFPLTDIGSVFQV